MIYYVTYSNELYKKSKEYSAKMALKKGKVDRVILYDPSDYDKDFFEKHREILEQKTGNGLWLWKPYFLVKALNTVKENDIVIYCDAASFFFRSCRPMVETMHDDIWVSINPTIEKQFTKPELFEMMNCVDKKYTETNQIQASFIAIRKTERGVKFAKKWLELCCMDGAMVRDTRYLTEPPVDFNFICHRSDQAVLSLLVKQWDIVPHRDPSQYGRVPEKYYSDRWMFARPQTQDTYRPFIILHRGKEPQLKVCINQWLCTWLPMPILKCFPNPCEYIMAELNRIYEK